MSDKLDEIFDVPKDKKETKKPCDEGCGCGKPPQKQNAELEIEINKYLDEVKKEVNKPVEQKKEPRKHILTAEGKEKMLANVKKAREARMRKYDIEKQKREAVKIEDKKPEPVKQESKTLPTTMEPVVSQPGQTKGLKTTNLPTEPAKAKQPIITAPPMVKYIIKSSFNKAPWVK
jgi:hypothetical protein